MSIFRLVALFCIIVQSGALHNIALQHDQCCSLLCPIVSLVLYFVLSGLVLFTTMQFPIFSLLPAESTGQAANSQRTLKTLHRSLITSLTLPVRLDYNAHHNVLHSYHCVTHSQKNLLTMLTTLHVLEALIYKHSDLLSSWCFT